PACEPLTETMRPIGVPASRRYSDPRCSSWIKVAPSILEGLAPIAAARGFPEECYDISLLDFVYRLFCQYRTSLFVGVVARNVVTGRLMRLQKLQGECAARRSSLFRQDCSDRVDEQVQVERSTASSAARTVTRDDRDCTHPDFDDRCIMLQRTVGRRPWI